MMNEIKHIDEVDKACVTALMANPRGSWRDLSLSTGIPEKKLSRRVNKLFEEHYIRTVAELNPLVVNRGITVHVWIGVLFGKEKAVAQFFSALPEVRVLFITTGMADIFLEIGLEKQSDLAVWMHDFVNNNSEIKKKETKIILKPFTWTKRVRKADDLLSTHYPDRHLSSDELKLIHLLSFDARLSIKQLAEQMQMSEHRSQKMLNDLLNEDAFSIRLDFEPSILGLSVEAILLIKIQPQHAQTIAQSLVSLTNTRCLFGISGESQFFWHVLCEDLADLWRLTTEELGKLEGIVSCNSNMVIGAYKRAGFMRKGMKIQMD